jgi:guanine nucleotide-binding protein G(I)/G(S)/G(T) subunit beta-1
MNNDSDILERCAAARREAEALKERIKQRKEALADTSCKSKKKQVKINQSKKVKNASSHYYLYIY